MIVIDQVHKSYRTYFGRKTVLDGISFTLPPDRNLGILGRNGAGKTTLMHILSGLEFPDHGRIDRGGLRFSWPIGRGGIRSSLTGRDNLRFISRVYGIDIATVTRFVEDFSELGAYLDMPVDTYSAGMRARLAFSLSMACEFDCYLIDEGFSAGDARFTERMNALFEERRSRSNMIVVSHDMNIIRRFCHQVGVMVDGKIVLFDSFDEAIALYKTL